MGWRWPCPDTLKGTNGSDDLLGRGGNDVLYGFDGRDNLLGGDGKDWVLGGDEVGPLDGDKYLVGGAGNDRMNGARGSTIWWTARSSSGSASPQMYSKLSGRGIGPPTFSARATYSRASRTYGSYRFGCVGCGSA